MDFKIINDFSIYISQLISKKTNIELANDVILKSILQRSNYYLNNQKSYNNLPDAIYHFVNSSIADFYRQHSNSELSPEDFYLNTFEEKELKDVINYFISRLLEFVSNEYREYIYAHDLNNNSILDIANQYNITPLATKLKIERARNQIRNAFDIYINDIITN